MGENGQNSFQELVHYFIGRKHVQGREDSTHHSCNKPVLSHTRKVRLDSLCCITAKVYCQLFWRIITHNVQERIREKLVIYYIKVLNPYPTTFPYGNGMVLHFYQQQESSTTKTVHKVINKGLKTYV